MSAAMVVARSVAKRYGERVALDGVDFAVRGGVCTVLGPNGAGKTTLLRCLATLITPDRGAVTVDELDARHHSECREIRRRLGYLPQQVGFAPRSRVFDVVDCVAVLKEHDDRRNRRREVSRVLELVGLAERARERVDTLSGGMRRRLGLANAILGSPSFVVLDEPAADLDPDQRLSLRAIVGELARRATVIVSSHQTDDAAAISDRLVVIDGGRGRWQGSPAELAAVARGRVWRSPSAPTTAVRAAWRLPTGDYHVIGDPPPGAAVAEPTLEDGYLWLLRSPARQ